MKFGAQRDEPGMTPGMTLPLEAQPDFVYEEPTPPPALQNTPIPGEEPLDIDWASVGLGLLALIAVGGLIPFWLWIYFVYNPPVK